MLKIFFLLILIIVTVMLDKNLLNVGSNEFYTTNRIDKHNKKTVWIYNNYITQRQDYTSTPPIIDLCIETVTRHLDPTYNILVFTQADIQRIVPEYVTYIESCKSPYIRDNLLKYAIIYKYGGVWLNCSTIVVNNFDLDESAYLQGKLIFFCERAKQYNDKFNSFDFTNIASIKNSEQIKVILDNLLRVSNTLNHDYSFNNLIESNLTEDANIHYMPISNNTIINRIPLDNKQLFGYSNTITLDKPVKFLCLDFKTLVLEPAYNSILTMTRHEILSSNLLFKKLIKYGLD